MVGLALDETGIPPRLRDTRSRRKIVRRAEEAGIPRKNILIDTLT